MADFAMLFGGKKEGGGKRPLPFTKGGGASDEGGDDWGDGEKKDEGDSGADLQRASKLLVRALGMNPADVDLEGVGEAIKAVVEAC